MREKKVWRYYCEYCKKAGCNKGVIRKHEERCTMNPNRYCGYCHLLEIEQKPIKELLAVLPNPEDIQEKCDFGDGEFGIIHFGEKAKQAMSEAMPKLRDITDGCPACILATLRQKGIPVPFVEDFNFKQECQKIWSDFNNSNITW